MAKIAKLVVSQGSARGFRINADAEPCGTLCGTLDRFKAEPMRNPLAQVQNEPAKAPYAEPFSENSKIFSDKDIVLGSNDPMPTDANMSAGGFGLGFRTKKDPPAGFAYKLSAADGEVYRLSHYSKDKCFATIVNARDGRRLEIFAGVWEKCFV